MTSERRRGTDAADVLRRRARQLAQRPAVAADTRMIELLEFQLGEERYALETRFVREVHPLDDLTPLPSTAVFLRGIVNVRGRLVPVFDLKRLFELPERGLTDLHQVVLIQADDVEIGLLVDTAVGVCTVPAAEVQPAPATLTGIRGDFLEGVTGDRLVVLNVPRILADPMLIVNDEPE